MTSSSSQPSAWFTQLMSEQVLTAQDQATLKNLLEESSHDESLAKNSATDDQNHPNHPGKSVWYLDLLIGFSAWLSSLFMIAFLFAAQILRFREKAGFVITGIIFLVAGIAIYLSFKKAHSIFLNQMALALAMTGRILCIFGFVVLLKNPTEAALATIAMEVVVLLVYAEKLQRFISTLMIHGSLLFLGTYLKNSTLIYLHIGALAFFVYLMWVYEPPMPNTMLQELSRPVVYGSAVALLGAIAFSTTPFMMKIIHVQVWWPITAVMGIVWLLSCLSIAHIYRVSLGSVGALLLVVTLVAFCGFAYQAPGITASGLILTLAYYRDEKLMAGLAILALITFVFFYYYGLRISLLDKSIAMLVPGVIVLLARGAFLKLVSPSPTTA